VRRVQLVLPKDADIDAGRVSILSYVGAGLIGLKEGQSINWPDTSGAARKLTLVKVEDAEAAVG
jgi:regulator of nucleoside diphosphate kinase